MCKYCEFDKDGYGGSMEYGNYIYRDKDEGTYTIDASVSGLDNYISVNYCPKCGRKLGE